MIAGQRDQGKSRFVNALLNSDLCPVGDDATTTIPTVLSHGPAPPHPSARDT
ncbi:dynamin family protein [Nocardia cyriacigeorgica]|uniref:dynamin family protein n=1 Tax=Nocardia cyriacigeorgica TaxID=135487 RepID=UPI003CC7F590